MTKSIESNYEMVNGKHYLLLETGKRPSDKVTDNPNDIASLGGENISDEGFMKFDNVRYITKEYFKTCDKGKIQKEDILINKDGAQTGKIAYVSEIPFGKSMINEHIFIIRNNGEFDQKFLFYFLLSFKGQKQIKSKIVGSAQGGISNSFIKGLYLPKPRKSTQGKIASILSTVDKNIEQIQKTIEKAEKLKKSMMQNLLTGKIKPDGTKRQEDEFYIDEKFGKVPKGWEVCKLKKHGNFYNGINFSKDQVGKGKLFVNLNDIFSNEIIDCSKLERLDSRTNQKVVLEENDLVFVRSSVKLEGIGLPSLFPGCSEKVTFCGFIIRYNYDKNRICPKYILNLLRFQNYRNKTISLGQILANTNITQRSLKNLKIILPKNYDEQKSIAFIFNNIDKYIEENQLKLSKLQKLKKSLMQNLLTGKIEVK